MSIETLHLRGSGESVPRNSDKRGTLRRQLEGRYLRNLLRGRTPRHFVVDLIITLVALLAIVVARNAEGG